MSFLGFEIAKSGLNAARYQMNVASNNISNIATPGYSRQIAVQVSTNPIHSYGLFDYTGDGVLGQGVTITGVQRVRNEFLDQEYRTYLSSTNYNYHMADGLSKLEDIINEPSDNGLNSNLSKLWNSLSQIASTPTDLSARSTFSQSVLTFTTAVNSMASKVDSLQNQYNQDLENIVTKVNSLTQSIHDLNKQIRDLNGVNNPANELKDARDNAVDELAKLIDIETYANEDGTISILSGGKLLVGINTQKDLSLRTDNTTGNLEVIWSEELTTFNLKGGHLKGVLDTINNTLPNFKNSLNSMISSMVDKFNEVHRDGFDLNGNPGVDLFVSTDGNPININNLTINPDILEDESLLAFSSDPNLSGDIGNLKDLIAIKDEKIVTTATGNNMTVNDFYNYTVTKIGLESSSFIQLYENDNATLQSVETQRLSVSSVSLDEETANLMQFQQIYTACSKVLQAVDEMLATLIEIA